MKKIKTLFIFFAVCLFPLFSDKGVDTRNIEQRLSDILDPKIAAELVQKKEIIKLKYGASNMKPEMLPVSAFSEKMLSLLSKKKPAFLGEFISLYKKEGPNNPDVSKILRHISGLEGIEYFSNSYQEMRTLYLTSHAVKEVKTSGGVVYEPIDDPLNDEFDGLEIFARQIDPTFGDFIYKYRYLKEDNGIGMICVNTQKITHPDMSLISLPPDAMTLSLAIYDLDDYILIHCLSSAKFPTIPFIGGRIKRAFSSRLTAVYNWFKDEYKCAEQGIEYSAKKKNNSDN
ncbi:hypothetical protein E4N87_04500 [Treponema denticola]|uniref:Uncharacterized protein n=1 Tax=Treponema denticola TaxID=158 RepID=A0A9Q9BIH1_TREDN|nr:DUF6675 family protein [Treponema denticola]UTC89992.1 hypothetical protein E4N87_04500 [Treponema denticola]UTD00655.1 hypothetical protein E4N86_08075 [Treponema denticola]